MTREKLWVRLTDGLVIRSSNHPIIAAFLCGIFATLTLPPVYLFPLVIPAYGGLFYLLNKAVTLRQAAKIGFFWGWGFYMSGLYWFVIALMTDPDKFAWLIPFALFALTAVIALYTLVFSILFFIIKNRFISNTGHPLSTALIFALLWTVVEYARGHLFTGFPWNLAGYVFGLSDASIQPASIVGIYGLTFIAVLAGIVCFTSKRAAIIVWLLLTAAVCWGAWRAENAPHLFANNVKLRLVQANIQQQHKWDPARQIQVLREQIALTQSAGQKDITHIIWPESAVPYLFSDNSTLAQRLGEVLLPGQHLITGVLRTEGDKVYNSIVTIDAKGAVVGHYNKHKLVPFGEFLPLRWLIPEALTTPVGMTDLNAGVGAQTLSWPGIPPVSPLICYEVMFPEATLAANARPAWLLSVTNDAWFGTSSGPYQHLAAARMRAVEQGLPMVRVANTGISAVYDAYGREVVTIPLNKTGVKDVELPEMSQFGTVYSRTFAPLLM